MIPLPPPGPDRIAVMLAFDAVVGFYWDLPTRPRRVSCASGEWALVCQVCGPVPFRLPEAAYWEEGRLLREIGALVRAHLHDPPKPLTKDEREAELVKMRHRRGAWRLA